MSSNCIEPPARRWRAIRQGLLNKKLENRAADIKLHLQKSNFRNRKLVNGPKPRDSTAPPTSRNEPSASSPAPSVLNTPRAKSTPVSDLMAPRKANPVVDPTLTTPVQASEPTKVAKGGRNIKVLATCTDKQQEDEPRVLAGTNSAAGNRQDQQLNTEETSVLNREDLEMDEGFLPEGGKKVEDGETNVPSLQTTKASVAVKGTEDERGSKKDGATESKAEKQIAIEGVSEPVVGDVEKKPDQAVGTQNMRGVAIKQARAEFEEVRDLYNTIKARVDKLQAKAEKGAIDAQLHILLNTLKDLNESMLAAEHELINVMTSAHPDVIFVPSVFVPAVNSASQIHPTPVAKKKKSKHGKKSSEKRKRSDGSQSDTKEKKKMKASDFALDEAVECNKETRADIGVKGKRPRIQSKEFVDDEDMPQGQGEVNDGETVLAPERVKKGKKKADAEDDEEEMSAKKKIVIPELYRKGEKPDLALIIKDITREEASEVKNFREQLVGFQFNWAEVMSVSVCNVINSWRFDKQSFQGKPTSADLGPHVDYVKALVDDHELMEKRLQTSPRIMQLSALDPFFTEQSIKWEELEKSTQYPFGKDMNGVIRALHAMCCRRSDSPTWTPITKLKGDIKNGYMILHNILAESLELIAYDATHEDIKIELEGEYAIPKRFLAMSQTVGWLFHQINVRSKAEGGPRRDRVSSASIGSLQKQFFLVLTGMMLVYESDTYNREVDKNMRNKKHPKNAVEVKQLKAIHKEQTVLRQLVNTQTRNASKRLKGLTGPSSSNVVKSKDQERKIAQTVNHDLSRWRGDAIQALSLFLLYGTAAFFHTWPTPRENTQHDAALLINLASILADRRWLAVEDQKHVFGARAWNRLDNLMYRALKRFLTDNGSLKHDIDWPAMTDYFSRKFEASHLAHMFTLDLLMETHRPGLSRGINGLVMPHVKLEYKEMWMMDGPATQSFRAIWGTTEGELIKASDGGSKMYPEVDAFGVRTPHVTAEKQMASDQARADIAASKASGSSKGENGGKGGSKDVSSSSSSASSSESSSGSEQEEEDDGSGEEQEDDSDDDSSGSDGDVEL